ncbi:hypothetical protein [Spartinivicinus ruber]|uniref:hypothetical protein n=1 Tax=Spartinivicinus ruber TaxID=2683272 RepID=UPI0013CFF098|nr:hypothetical protein [Spartinivicinus ruber]
MSVDGSFRVAGSNSSLFAQSSSADKTATMTISRNGNTKLELKQLNNGKFNQLFNQLSHLKPLVKPSATSHDILKGLRPIALDAN